MDSGGNPYNSTHYSSLSQMPATKNTSLQKMRWHFLKPSSEDVKLLNQNIFRSKSQAVSPNHNSTSTSFDFSAD